MPAKIAPTPPPPPDDYDRDAIFDPDGPISPAFVDETVRAVFRSLPLESREPQGWVDRRMSAALSAISALHPRDEIEMMLAAQAVAAHHAAMNAWYLAMNADTPHGASTRHIAAAGSAARIFDTMLKALERRQAKPLQVPAGRPPNRVWPAPEGGAQVDAWARRVTGEAANDDEANPEAEPAHASPPPDPSIQDRPCPRRAQPGDRAGCGPGDQATGDPGADGGGASAPQTANDSATPLSGGAPVLDVSSTPSSEESSAPPGDEPSAPASGEDDRRVPVWTITAIEMARQVRDQTLFQEDYAGLDLARTAGIRADGSIIVPEDPTPEQEAYMARRYALNIRKTYHENLLAGIKELPKIIALRPGDLIP